MSKAVVKTVGQFMDTWNDYNVEEIGCETGIYDFSDVGQLVTSRGISVKTISGNAHQPWARFVGSELFKARHHFELQLITLDCQESMYMVTVQGGGGSNLSGVAFTNGGTYIKYGGRDDPSRKATGLHIIDGCRFGDFVGRAGSDVNGIITHWMDDLIVRNSVFDKPPRGDGIATDAFVEYVTRSALIEHNHFIGGEGVENGFDAKRGAEQMVTIRRNVFEGFERTDTSNGNAIVLHQKDGIGAQNFDIYENIIKNGYGGIEVGKSQTSNIAIHDNAFHNLTRAIVLSSVHLDGVRVQRNSVRGGRWWLVGRENGYNSMDGLEISGNLAIDVSDGDKWTDHLIMDDNRIVSAFGGENVSRETPGGEVVTVPSVKRDEYDYGIQRWDGGGEPDKPEPEPCQDEIEVMKAVSSKLEKASYHNAQAEIALREASEMLRAAIKKRSG